MNPHFIAAVCILLLNESAHANAIFPAFQAPYFSQLFFPWALLAVLVVEAVVIRWRCSTLNRIKIIVLVVASNAFSWFIGQKIAGAIFPSGLAVSSRGFLTEGPDFTFFAALAFPIAYVLSVLIEGGCYKLAAYKWPISKPFLAAFLANTSSYIVLSVIVWLSLLWLRV